MRCLIILRKLSGITGAVKNKVSGKKILVLNRSDRGVGISRNLALDNAWGDVVLFSDDDIVYEEDYAARIIQAFRRRPTADILLFNVRGNGISI